MKECASCKITKPLVEFYKSPRNPDICRGKCKDCFNKIQKLWWQRNKHRQPGYNRTSKENRRRKVFDHYGGAVCALCDIEDLDVLSLDHIDGGGSKQRKEFSSWGGHQLYLWVIKNNYPKGFRVLCRNCNWKEFLRLKRG